jgi:leader peptidase (prepilin peptidase)/N-methyltransferase
VTGLQLYIDFIVFTFGAVVGSFLNVCIHRLPLDQSIVFPPSHCPHCNQGIRWSDNIPLFSYLALGRKCRNCGAKISSRYFLVELLTAVLFLLMWLKLTQWDNPPVHGIYFLKAPIYWMIIAGLIVATFIDFEHYIIPNEITFGGIIVGLVLSTVYPPLQPDDLLTSSILKLSPIAIPACGVAFFRSFFGMFVGGMILFSIAEFGKLLFGRLRVPLGADATVVIADGKLKLPEEEVLWPDLFFRESDKIRFTAASLKFGDKQFTDAVVIVMENSIRINGEDYPLADIGTIEAKTNEIVIPREAMGFGDVKLLAGIGALLGWEATVFSIFLSSATGALVGLALIAFGKKDLQGRIPYGPYIALGALVWLFAEDQLLAIMAAYLGNIKDLLTMVFSRG